MNFSKKIGLMSTLILGLLFSQNLLAQEDNFYYLQGSVLAIKQANLKTKSLPTDKANLNLRKYRGAAKTQLYVYKIDKRGRETLLDRHLFESSKSIQTYEKTYSGVKDHRLCIMLKNTSKTKSFVYKVKVNEVSSPIGSQPINPNYGGANSKKKASLTIVSFEDTKFENLFQNAQIAYGNCFEGYDKSVLLKRRYSTPRKPTVHISDPSKENFFEELKELADDGYMIDLFIFSHGSTDRISIRGEDITGRDITRELNAGRYSGGKFPIRMVYQMNCNGSTLNNEWTSVGAKAVCGSRFINFYSNQFNRFAREWNRGTVAFEDCLARANTASARTVMHTLILGDARGRSNFVRCKIPFSVLTKGRCAESYFIENWLSESQWQDGLSGKDNMTHSSDMRIGGDRLLTKNSNPTW